MNVVGTRMHGTVVSYVTAVPTTVKTRWVHRDGRCRVAWSMMVDAKNFDTMDDTKQIIIIKLSDNHQHI